MEKLMRSRQSVTNHNTPRSIRARLAAPRRRPADGPAPAGEPAPQAVAVSVAGKTAMGPWMGSFGAIGEGSLGDGEPSSPTLFATSQGRVFADLSGSPAPSMDMNEAAEAAVAAAAPADHPEGQRLARRAVRAELGVLQRKAEPRRTRGAPGPAPNVARRRMRMIAQARKAN